MCIAPVFLRDSAVLSVPEPVSCTLRHATNTVCCAGGAAPQSSRCPAHPGLPAPARPRRSRGKPRAQSCRCPPFAPCPRLGPYRSRPAAAAAAPAIPAAPCPAVGSPLLFLLVSGSGALRAAAGTCGATRSGYNRNVGAFQ